MSGVLDVTQMKLGKQDVKTDVRTLLLARYVDKTALAPAPAKLDLFSAVDEWPMYDNDKLGDCTCAAAGHMIEAWTAADTGGEETAIADDAVVEAYDAVRNGGEGAVELDVLNYWHKTGVGGHTIGAFAKVTTVDHDLVRSGTAIFYGLYIGLQLPISAQHQETWDFNGNLTGDNEPRSWGGHAVNVVGYDADTLTIVTWGSLKKLTWTFWDRYCDEAYCIISPDFLGPDGHTPSGLDMKALQSDLQLVSA